MPSPSSMFSPGSTRTRIGPIFGWTAAFLGAYALLLGLESYALEILRRPTDSLPMIGVGWLGSAMLGLGLSVAWSVAAVRARRDVFAANTLCYLTAGVALLIATAIVISPFAHLSSSIRLFDLLWIVLPGLIITMLAGSLVIILLRGAATAKIFVTSGIITGLSLFAVTVLVLVVS